MELTNTNVRTYEDTHKHTQKRKNKKSREKKEGKKKGGVQGRKEKKRKRQKDKKKKRMEKKREGKERKRGVEEEKKESENDTVVSAYSDYFFDPLMPSHLKIRRPMRRGKRRGPNWRRPKRPSGPVAVWGGVCTKS